jgi:predicted nucleic acid-binding protein
MILLDTNVLIYAFGAASDHRDWARYVIADGVARDGAAVNAATLAELCVGDAVPSLVADRVRSWDVAILDIPAAAAEIAARAYRVYRQRRQRDSGKWSPMMPLPDFFIGAHSQLMGWPLATADADRYKTYFPKVRLRLP